MDRFNVRRPAEVQRAINGMATATQLAAAAAKTSNRATRAELMEHAAEFADDAARTKMHSAARASARSQVLGLYFAAAAEHAASKEPERAEHNLHSALDVARDVLKVGVMKDVLEVFRRWGDIKTDTPAMLDLTGIKSARRQ